jgi:hypothetical protein
MNTQINFVQKLKDKRSSSILTEIEKFINHDFLYMQNLKQEELSKNIQDFITKILFDFVKLWDIVKTEINNSP